MRAIRVGKDLNLISIWVLDSLDAVSGLNDFGAVRRKDCPALFSGDLCVEMAAVKRVVAHRAIGIRTVAIVTF